MQLYGLLEGSTFGLREIGAIILGVGILLAMVTVHEFGHYVAGKILGFKITEFSVGFGPAIFKRRSKKTGELFALRIVPLGGYCAFDGEDDVEDDAAKTAQKTQQPFDELVENTLEDGDRVVTSEQAVEEKTISTPEHKQDEFPQPKGKRFNEQPPWKRIIVLVSGAIMNYILALILILIMTASYGVPMCIVMPTDYQTNPDVPHAEWTVETLAPRDILLKIDGEKIAMPTDCIDALEGKKAGDEVSVLVLRYHKESKKWLQKTVTLTLQADGTFKDIADDKALSAAMGLQVYTTALKRGFWETIGGAFAYSYEMGTSVLRSLGELITGGLGIESMGGPVTTIGAAAKAAADPFTFLYMAGFIGVNLAVFNLLPVPALDGSKVVFCLIEWIFKKPVNRKVEAIIHAVGIVLLFVFAILVDILHFAFFA